MQPWRVFRSILFICKSTFGKTRKEQRKSFKQYNNTKYLYVTISSVCGSKDDWTELKDIRDNRPDFSSVGQAQQRTYLSCISIDLGKTNLNGIHNNFQSLYFSHSCITIDMQEYPLLHLYLNFFFHLNRFFLKTLRIYRWYWLDLARNYQN